MKSKKATGLYFVQNARKFTILNADMVLLIVKNLKNFQSPGHQQNSYPFSVNRSGTRLNATFRAAKPHHKINPLQYSVNFDVYVDMIMFCF